MRTLVTGGLLWILAGATASGQAHPAGGTGLSRAVEEFKSQTRALGLRADSPTVRTQRRNSGRWHGRLFEYFRNDFLDAIPHEIQQRGGKKGLLRRNQFGFNVAGPVVLPRLYNGARNTFFSLSYEGVRERIARTSLYTVPILPERAGDWSQTVDQAGRPLPIYDPATTRPNPNYDPGLPVSAGNVIFARDPFPVNRIPSARIDPVSQRALSHYPAPNDAVGPFFRNNYFIVAPEGNTANGVIGKVDYNLGEKQRFAFDVSLSNGLSAAPRLFASAGNPGASDRRFSTRRSGLDHVYTFSAQTLNTLSFEVSSSVSQRQRGEERVSPADLGLRGPLSGAFPFFEFSPYLGMGAPNPVSRTANNLFQFRDAFSQRRGKHRLRGSMQYRHYQVHVFLPQYPAGRFTFTPNLTSLPGVVNTGHGFASFLLGLPEFGEVSIVDSPSYFRRSTWQITVGDQYDLRRGLVLSGATTLDISTPRTEKFDRQSTVDLRATRPDGRVGALVAANRGGYGRAFQPVRPRLEVSAGIAWNPRNDPKTVVRLNYGRSYSSIPIYGAQWGTQGFTGSLAYISPNPQLSPAITLRDGAPPPEFPFPDLRPEAADETIADLIDMGDGQPVYQSASLSVERELPSAIVLTVAAAYSGGRDLLVSNNAVNLNALPLDTLRFRDALNDERFNRSLRPYPQFRGLDVYSSYPAGRYRREAAFVRVEKRLSQGLSFTAYYEFSKQRDDYSGPFGTQDFYNRRKEWSLTAYNNPHRFSLNYLYELPFGPAKNLLAYSDWRRYLVDGWSLSGTTTVSSGEPLALRPQFNNTGGAVPYLNVNVVPGVDPRVPDPGPELWFNPAAFDQPPDFTIGDASRTHPYLLAPGAQNHDLSVTKRFAISSERTLEFSAAGFNFINTANWNNPDTVIGPRSAPNVNAGRIIGSRGGRVVQLGLRFSF